MAATTKTSHYGPECAGKLMANGAKFDPAALSVASWDFPLGTKLKVSCTQKNAKEGGRSITTSVTTSVIVTVTDRGPAKRLYNKGRKLDLSDGAFKKLAPLEKGVIVVDYEVVTK